MTSTLASAQKTHDPNSRSTTRAAHRPKGFAEKSLERPARYLPRLPEEALGRSLEARRSQIREFANQRNSWTKVAEILDGVYRRALHER